MRKLKLLCHCLLFLFFKFFVAYFPVWTVRKFLYRLFGMKIGRGSRIGIGTMVISPWKIQIGENSIINENCHLDGRGGLKIGNNVSISLQTIVLSASHDSRSESFEYIKKPVCIEDNVWIGARSIILEGSHLEYACLVGAGSTLRGMAQRDWLYSGVPAQKIRPRGLRGAYELQYRPFFI